MSISAITSGSLTTTEVAKGGLPTVKDLTAQRIGSDSTVVTISAAARDALDKDASTSPVGSPGKANPMQSAKVAAAETKPSVPSSADVNRAAAEFYAQMSPKPANDATSGNISVRA